MEFSEERYLLCVFHFNGPVSFAYAALQWHSLTEEIMASAPIAIIPQQSWLYFTEIWDLSLLCMSHRRFVRGKLATLLTS